MSREESYSALSKTLYLRNVDGDAITKVQNRINETKGTQVIAATIEPVICEGGATNGRFYVWVYLKTLPNIKLKIEDVFVKKEVKSLLK